MLDIKRLEKNEPFMDTGMGYADYYRDCLKARGVDPSEVDRVLELNGVRKQKVHQAEEAKADQNKMGKQIAQMKKNKEDAAELIQQMQKVSGQVKDLMREADEAGEKVDELLGGLPNHLHPSTPHGAGEEQNEEVKAVGSPSSFSFQAKDHADLGEALGIVDFERATKVTGARFTYLKGAGAHLERALAQFMLDIQTKEHGYTEMSPPLMVNAQSMFGTTQFPKFRNEQFEVAGTDYFLIATAEIPVTNYFAKEILNASDLPQCFTAHTPCFRAEAGSYGKDTKGLFRQHQFYKVELVKFTHPQESYEEHEKLTENAERILEMLELPYKRTALCSGDISFGASKCYDLEVWLPGQNQYREISSCSNFEDFQARRANIRFREDGGKPQFVHTLNGSGLAIGRTWIAIVENYQQEDGSIIIPEVLRPYMGGQSKIT